MGKLDHCLTCEEDVASAIRWDRLSAAGYSQWHGDVLFYSWPGICCCRPLWCQWPPEKLQRAPGHLGGKKSRFRWLVVHRRTFQARKRTEVFNVKTLVRNLLMVTANQLHMKPLREPMFPVSFQPTELSRSTQTVQCWNPCNLTTPLKGDREMEAQVHFQPVGLGCFRR